MPTVNEIAETLAEALPRESPLGYDIVAVGMLAHALIAEAPPDERSQLVERFCTTLRECVALELN